jgi:hypothetical protein
VGSHTNSGTSSTRSTETDEVTPTGHGAESAGRPARRRLLWLVLAALTVIVLAVVTVVALDEDQGMGSGSAPAPDSGPVSQMVWMSGVAGAQTASGEFADWRGTPTELAGTWSDNNDNMVNLWQLRSGAEYDSWDGSLDIAIGAIDESESWGEAAEGAYDERWRESLMNLRDAWGTRTGTVYIRFAHEMNGDWFPWAVTADNHLDFIEAWKRFRELQQELFPAAQLVFCVNRVSVNSGIDWRETFPGVEYVDVMGVDYYNWVAELGTDEQWQAAITHTDEFGGPIGIEGHRQFAENVGLPLAVPEWSGDADVADSPEFFTRLFGYFSDHAGTGAGQILYEILFNVEGYDERFRLYPETRMPESAAVYQQFW